MIDAAELKKHVDLLALIGADTALRRVAGTGGGEFAGPCPFCGGKDRLRVQPERGLWWCRQCGDKWSDAIAYVQKRDGLDFVAACERLAGGAAPAAAPKPKVAPPSPPIADVEPTDAWRKAALAFVAECEARLWSPQGAPARAWLNGRGLADATLREWHVGYNAQGRRGWPGGVVLPGFAVDGRLWYVKVRQPEGREPKYLHVDGGHPAPIGRLTDASVLLLLEGEFDLFLAWQAAGDLVATATFGSDKAQPSDRWLPYLLRYSPWIVCYDIDESGEAGAAKWRWTARARRVRVPLDRAIEGKDLTDLWRAGGDVRAWIKVALMAAAVGDGGVPPDRALRSPLVREAVQLGATIEAVSEDAPGDDEHCAVCGADVWIFAPDGRPLCEEHAAGVAGGFIVV